MKEQRVNCELVSVWKEAVVVYFKLRCQHRICLMRLRKSKKNLTRGRYPSKCIWNVGSLHTDVQSENGRIILKRILEKQFVRM